MEGMREQVEREQKRREALERVVERLVGMGRGGSGWGDASLWDGTPLSAPRVEIVRSPDEDDSASS